MEIDEKKAALVKKIAEAADAVGGVEKKGKNEAQGYKYLKAADVAKAFRHELLGRGVLLLQNEMAPEYIEYQTAKGTRGIDCRMAIEFEMTDGYASIFKMAHAQAMDTSDKAGFKAKTGALKYFLRGLGLIPDEKDDPETDSPDAEFTKKDVDAKIAAMTGEMAWRNRLKDVSTVAGFNSLLPEADKAGTAIQRLIGDKAQACGFEWNDKLYGFYDPSDVTGSLEASLLVTEADVPQTPTEALQRQADVNPVVPTSRLITDKQRKRMFAISKAKNWPEVAVRDLLGSYGFEHSTEVTMDAYEDICKALEAGQ